MRHEVGLIFSKRQNRFRGQVYFCVSSGPAVDPMLVIVEGTNQLHKFNLYQKSRFANRSISKLDVQFLKSRNDIQRLQCNADDAVKSELTRTCFPYSRRN